MFYFKNIVSRHLKQIVMRVFILLQLAKRDMHGYEILKLVRKECTKHPFVGKKVSTGMVYSILSSLEEEGAVSSRWETGSGRARKMLSITSRGRKMLKSAKRCMREVFSTVRQWAPEVFA